MPLRESVASSIRKRNISVSISGTPQPVAALEPKVDREQDEQRDTSSIAEVVGVAGERVRPVDVRALDRAVDVDLAGAAGQRREDGGVEIPPVVCAIPSWRTP